MGEHYDVVIVGSGAGGATLAHRLGPSGKRVLVLERGDRLRREAESSQVYGAALYRLRERDFGELKHYAGLSPAWPIDYDVLEPYYQQAEELYQVHGARGEDPTEPPASSPYPRPPVSHEPRVQRLFDDLAGLGLHPFHSPTGMLLDEARPEVRQARVDLVRNAVVRRLETDASGRTVTSVVADVDGVEEHFDGDIVVVSAGAVDSARLLLASANDRHPHGLANGSDQVGRNYVSHASQVCLAVSDEPHDTRFPQTLALNDYYFGDADFDFPMGSLQLVGLPSGPAADTADTLALRLSVEDLPHPGNRVTLDRAGGVALSHSLHNREPLEQLHHRVRAQLDRLGLRAGRLISPEACNGVPAPAADHQAGTVRFGSDPETSVLDPDCKAHELDNLYVVDTSFFPSIGSVGPALTAMANALRVGDHLLERLG